ncbi:amino acid ABC transporter ATP-binding/permease protein [Lentzea flava]|uniref:Thiol reductant ABC exporter subunit CydC n=1 Tax=Lentzea flava TaxID=103732 RepID=A0ABQ2V1W8_9PSEU|nr:ATP-binding cassette domain-containing protein [Lentzea flava]MCP2202356.1 ATP-binding cassette, subfamily C, CydC [Lentzea flava]GGU60872.1 thiol reductant ABC exporter subunit CydC [Lentzea flava]
MKLAIFVGVLAELAGVGLTATATWLIMRAAEHPPMQALTVAIVAVRTLALAKGALRYLERLTSHKAVLSEAVELRGRVYDDLAHRRHIPSGTALTRIVTNVDQHLDSRLRTTLPWVTAALVSAVMAVFSLPLAIGLLINVVLLPWLAIRKPQDLTPLRAKLTEQTTELVHSKEELIAYGLFDEKLRAATRTAKELSREERTRDLTPLAIAVQFGAALLMLAQHEPAWLIMAAIATFEITVPLAALTRPAPEPTDEPEPSHNPDFPVPHGKTAIVGPSGSGKTTLLNAIAHQLEPSKGALADAHVFHTTVRTNVLLAKPDATQAELDRAAAITELDLDWDQVVGERGEEISGGQRQRLILTRSVLANPEVLLMDEPTEGLDPEQADRVLKNVLDNCRGTALVVTHREEQLALFDHVHHRGPIRHEHVGRVG